MCGIFGIIAANEVNYADFQLLADHAMQRGQDSSGLLVATEQLFSAYRADFSIKKLLHKTTFKQLRLALGHSRLITNGLNDNQPVIRGEVAVLHNGIIANVDEVWQGLEIKRHAHIDSEVIAAIAEEGLRAGLSYDAIVAKILSLCKGVVACAMALPKQGKLLLFSNNGSLYLGRKQDAYYFASESYALEQAKCEDIKQIKQVECLDILCSEIPIDIIEKQSARHNLIPELVLHAAEEKLLQFSDVHMRRCTKCILPETMPFIEFDSNGVCNYCLHYTPRNNPKPIDEIFALVEPYRRKHGNDCIVPFSGGRDSCYALHLIVKELKMKPVTYTYDWGMVTDLGRRNISRMSAELGVENIIVAADIAKKRRNISMNLAAWLKSPNLGMISIFTAGDKHFFKYIETIKRQTGINLNLWGINPLEVTHFKSGFLGIKPDFVEKRVYTHGALKQLNYQYHRFKAMLKSPGYFNTSLWDTLSGEYYRSFTEKKDYYHIFDYWRWDEETIDNTLASYEWEKAIDTCTTWRIGDGTAAFYNYVYYLVAGFTEHDTFRSNQIREGQISRTEALKRVAEENRPRYANIRWYLDALNMDFKDVIRVVNNIPKLYTNE